MKKIMPLVLVFIMVLAFAGCGKQEEQKETFLTAEVIEIEDAGTKLTIKPWKEDHELFQPQIVIFAISSDQNKFPNIEIGDIIKISYAGDLEFIQPEKQAITTINVVGHVDKIAQDN